MATQIFTDEPTLHQDYLPNEQGNPLNCGPFGWAGRSFGVFVDTETNHIEVWSSTDSWVSKVEEDSSNKPSCSPANFGVNDPTDLGYGWETYDAVQHPTLPELYILYLDTTDALAIKVFSLSARAWGATLAGGPIPTVRGSNPQVQVQFAYRLLNNDFVVGYYAPSPIQSRAVVCTRAGSWASSFQLSIHSSERRLRAMVAANVGGTSKVHLFFTVSNNSPIQHRTLNEDNSVELVQTLFTKDASFDTLSMGRSIVNPDTGEVILPFWTTDFSPLRSIVKVARATSAQVPTWTIQDVVDTGTSKVQSQVGYLQGAIFFNVAAQPSDINTGRGSPYWDIPTSSWWHAVDPVGISAGNLFAVWRQLAPEAIYGSTYASIGGWSAPFLLVAAADIAIAGPSPRLFRINTGVRATGLGNLNSILGAMRSLKVG